MPFTTSWILLASAGVSGFVKVLREQFGGVLDVEYFATFFGELGLAMALRGGGGWS